MHVSFCARVAHRYCVVVFFSPIMYNFVQVRVARHDYVVSWSCQHLQLWQVRLYNSRGEAQTSATLSLIVVPNSVFFPNLKVVLPSSNFCILRPYVIIELLIEGGVAQTLDFLNLCPTSRISECNWVGYFCLSEAAISKEGYFSNWVVKGWPFCIGFVLWRYNFRTP